MKKFLICTTLLIIIPWIPNYAQNTEKTDGPALKVFQFPQNRIPRIDGDFSDWDIVPEEYVIGMGSMREDEGKYSGPDPSTLDIKVKVGWVNGLNRLYVCYEAYDNYWEFNGHDLRNDTFELVVDGDKSGGPHIARFRPNPETVSESESFFTFQNCHAQNYHIMTPAFEGKSWTMVWGPQQWLKYFPYSNCAYSYDFKDGEPGLLKMEFYITVYDYASPEGPEKSVESKFYEGKKIGLCWAVIDYDGKTSKDGFWNLSPYHKMYGDASLERQFTLQPLENRRALQAAWSHKVKPGTREVTFSDESTGDITSWLWEFGDDSTSTEKDPVHNYPDTSNQYSVTLTVKGPSGESTCCKVWEVCVP